MSVAALTLVIAGFLVVISLVQPAAARLRLPYTVLLAIVAVLAAAAAIGFSLSLASVPLTVGLLLGVIVATTDPAAVVAILREMGAPPRSCCSQL